MNNVEVLVFNHAHLISRTFFLLARVKFQKVSGSIRGASRTRAHESNYMKAATRTEMLVREKLNPGSQEKLNRGAGYRP